MIAKTLRFAKIFYVYSMRIFGKKKVFVITRRDHKG